MTTVVGPFKRGDNSVYVGRIQFRPLDLPAVAGGQSHVGGTIVRVAGVDGLWTQALQLTPGGWAVYFPSAQFSGPVYLNVPDDAETWPVSALVVDSLEQALTEPSVEGAVPDLAALRALPWSEQNGLVWVRSDANGLQSSWWWNGMATGVDDGVTFVRSNEFATYGRGGWERGGI